jgi:CheY-like chemotaxis protein
MEVKVKHAFRILSVGYEPVLMQSRKQLLRSAGYEVVEATGYSQAVTLLNAESFDVLVLGHSLPEFHRQRVIEAAETVCPELPILFLSVGFDGPSKESIHRVDAYQPREVLDMVAELVAAGGDPPLGEEPKPERA